VRQDIMQDGTSARYLCLQCYVDWTRVIPKELGGQLPWHSVLFQDIRGTWKAQQWDPVVQKA